jgi:hypothetical protein
MQYKKIQRKEILIRQKKAGWKFFSLIHIFTYEPCPQLAYIKYEAKMP